MNKTLHGTIHGKTIRLDEDPGMVEGQVVEIQMKVISPPAQSWGDGIRNSAGGWVDYPELDEVFKTIHQERTLERPSQMGNE